MLWQLLRFLLEPSCHCTDNTDDGFSITDWLTILISVAAVLVTIWVQHKTSKDAQEDRKKLIRLENYRNTVLKIVPSIIAHFEYIQHQIEIVSTPSPRGAHNIEEDCTSRTEALVDELRLMELFSTERYQKVKDRLDNAEALIRQKLQNNGAPPSTTSVTQLRIETLTILYGYEGV